jgi:hypothetical protein
MESDNNSVNVGLNSDRENSLLDNEISVTDFTNTIRHMKSLFASSKMLVSNPTGINRCALMMGQAFHDAIIDLWNKNFLHSEEDLILQEEESDHHSYVEVSSLIFYQQ